MALSSADVGRTASSPLNSRSLPLEWSGVFDVPKFAESLVGENIFTIGTGARNEILEVRDGRARVRTQHSSEQGEWIELALAEDALRQLESAGELRVNVETLGHRRTSFVGALLAAHPTVIARPKPTRLIVARERSLSRQLDDTMVLIGDSIRGGSIASNDPLYDLVTETLRDSIAAVVGNDPSYKLMSSVGAGNWAETVWAAVFDLNVTDRATQGYYVVYLFGADGDRVHLSLCQATTAVRESFGGRAYLSVLRSRAESYAGMLGESVPKGFVAGPIDLGGSKRSSLTRGYEAGSIVSIEYKRGNVPSDEIAAEHLRRMLGLYSTLTESIDATLELESPTTDVQPSRTEARRMGRHLRAEGRNRAAARDAKKLHGYWCDVCEVNFTEQFGEPGSGCIDAHHLVPFSDLDERPRDIAPGDFAIVCSNCHRLIHSETPPLSVPETRSRFGFG
jgi:5-methylcytosine-specific restriction protein A